MKGRLFAANLIGIIVIVALIMGGFYYYLQSSQYIKTEDARVAGDIINLSAPAAGTLTNWDGKEGDVVAKAKVVGQVSDGTKTVNVSPALEGTIVKNQAKEGQMVQPGQTLAQLIDMKKLYIVANIDETDVKDIQIGSDVEVTVDGDSSNTLKGKVEEIGRATNSVFSLLPVSNTSGNYTKVTQKVQIKISISNYSDNVLPGMNAEVKITKNNVMIWKGGAIWLLKTQP
ncbi:HlyD family secretion protein [Paenibacillus sp. JMULE4]|uniref:HlyD family secretion protein n=1 Tax=Paenibacillus sp. JMULE4 TaxID=2518342 RepID=UPI0015750D2D|nr:HlyD family efflux transporter periplasmic adaptor subunit [Paenibacillus sp. JMULE4]NTZ16729.1 HlyD family secretion protein [Paenibacillus sp. JMULE4]